MVFTKRKKDSNENDGPINENYAKGLLLSSCRGITISSSYKSVGNTSTDEERYEQISEINTIPPSPKILQKYKSYFIIEPQIGETAEKSVSRELLSLKDRIINDLYFSYPKISSQVTRQNLRKRDGELEISILKN